MSMRSCTRFLQLHGQQIRPFSRTTCWRLAAPKIRSQSPPQSIAPRNVRCASQLGRPVKVSKAKPSHAPRKAQPPPPPPPKPPQAPIRSGSIDSNTLREQHAERLLGARDHVLLYKAPGHNAFMIVSYIAGAAIVYWAAWTGQAFLSAPMSDNVKYAKYILIPGAVLAAVMGCTVGLAPFRLLRSVRLVRKGPSGGSGGEGLTLQFEGKRALPFLPPKQMELPLGSVWADRNVPMSLTTWSDVPLVNAGRWSEGQLPNPMIEGFARLGLFQKLVYLSASIMPAMKRTVNKMFSREGMVYMRIGHQNWKMDLQRCEILQGGGPLMSLIEHDPGVKGTIYDSIRRQLFR